MKFSGVITIDKSDVHANGQGQRLKVKVTDAKTQFSCFRTITPVWIHIWWRHDVQGLMWHRRGALLFFKVICQISRSHRTKHSQFWPNLGIFGLEHQFEFTDGYEMMHKVWSTVEEVPYCFSRSSVKVKRDKNSRFSPKLSVSGLQFE